MAQGSQRSSVDEVRGAFEQAYRNGPQPRIEDYLKQVPESSRPVLFKQLLAIELDAGADSFTPLNRDTYDRRFPEQKDAISELFAQRARLSDTGDSFDPIGATQETPDDGASAPQPEPLPERFGNFRVTERLGQGFFGVVYKGHHDVLDKDVAIKVPHQHRIRSAEDVAAYKAEAQKLAGLNHSGIVTVTDYGATEDGRCYVVSEFVSGGTLRDRLREGPLPREEAVEIVATAAEALHYAHAKGLVHRDIKPENMLLDAAGRPVIADFGLAVDEEEQRDLAGQFAGTRSYMAPEQVRGQVHHLDGRTDIWALGVVLYELLTDRRPFGGRSAEELSQEILERPPKPPRMLDASIPQPLEKVCLKALSKNVTDRYSSAIDFANDLRRAANASEPRTHNSWLVAGGSLAALIIAAAAWAWNVNRGGDVEPAPSDGSLPAVASAKTVNDEPPASVADSDASLVPLSAELNLRIHSPQDPTRQGLLLTDPRALPLRPGDGVRVEAHLNRPSYLYVAWIGVEGELSPVYPWLPGDWEAERDSEAPIRSLVLPEPTDKDAYWPLDAAAGMETVLLLARDEPLSADFDLKSLLGEFPPQPLEAGGRRLLWLHEPASQTRLPDFSARIEVENPALQRLRTIESNLSAEFQLIEAVSFAKTAD